MKGHRVFVVSALSLAIANASAAPSLKMPVPVGEFWTMTRGYEQETNINYRSPDTQDKYALDFAQAGCDAYGKSTLAVAAGVVEFAGAQGAYGNTVVVDHGDGYKSRYAHLSSVSVNKNDVVQQGQEIGKIGNTGNVSGDKCRSKPGTHLHFVMYHNGEAYRPEPIDGYTDVGNINGALYYSSNYMSGQEDIDSSCRSNASDPRVERFRNSSGNLVVNMCPTDGRVYYYADTSCNIGYIDLFADTDGSGGYEVCGGSSVGDEYYGTDPISGSGYVPPADSQSSDPVNLKLDFDIMHPDDYELYAGHDTLGPPLAVDLRVRVTAVGGDAGNWADPGKDKIEIDYFVRYEPGGDWVRINRGYITIAKLDEDTTIQETFRYPIPAGLSVSQLSFKTVIDAEDEVDEYDDGDNISRVETYAYDRNVYSFCDLAVQSVSLDDGKTSLLEGESYGLKGAVRNIGTSMCPNGIRSTYYEKTPGGSFVAIADDGSDQWELVPGRDQWEHTMNQPFTASVPGTHEIMFCADSGNQNPETDEANNCLTSTYDVLMHRPDLIISDLRLCNGKTTLKMGDRFGLCLNVSNVGNKGSDGSRVAYYLAAPGGSHQYQTDDAIRSLVPGDVGYEETLNEPFTATIAGTWEALGRADYQGVLAESDEGNNDRTFQFTVIPADPNLTVADLYLKVGSSIVRQGGTVKKGSYVHPQCTVMNTGNGNAPRDSYQYYYINADRYRDKDVTTQGEMCAGCAVTHGVAGDSIKLGDTGSRTYRCCADATGLISESDEGDNCRTISFTVR